MTRDDHLSLIQVGGGRGFVIEANDERYVITAGHCLPEMPPRIAAMHLEEKTWPLLAPLGEDASIRAECLFVDLIADVAVLGEPDGQVWLNDALAWEELVCGVSALAVADIHDGAPVWVPGLDGARRQFTAGVVRHRALWLNGAGIEGGMSGSPILTADGKAIGICTTSSEVRGALEHLGPHGPQVYLCKHLPGWLL